MCVLFGQQHDDNDNNNDNDDHDNDNEKSLSMVLELTIELDCLIGSPWDPPVYIPSTDVPDYCCDWIFSSPFLKEDLVMQLRLSSLCLHDKPFTDSHLPSLPWFIFYKIGFVFSLLGEKSCNSLA